MTTRNDDGLSAANGRKMTLAEYSVQLASQWDRERNRELSPEHVSIASNYHASWRCEHEPEHFWVARVVDRTRRGDGCPLCAGRD
jgi:hypothetical protein